MFQRTAGVLSASSKERTALRQVVGYRELSQLFQFYQEFEIVLFDEAAAQVFDDLRKQKLRLGTMDLKIAATALVNNALLLSANRSDFDRVPELQTNQDSSAFCSTLMVNPPFNSSPSVYSQSFSLCWLILTSLPN